jgi:hypothetical protein
VNEPFGISEQAIDSPGGSCGELGGTPQSGAMDRRAALLRVVIPRGWLVISLLAVAPGFVSGTATPAGLAVALGGALFAYKSFWKLVRGLSDLAEAAVSWEQVAPVFRAANREERAAMAVPAAARPARRRRS